eukprot:g62.t1
MECKQHFCKGNCILLTFIVILLCVLNQSFFIQAEPQLSPRKQISIDDPKVISAAKFAVGELQELSDSGVYKSLSLSNIVKAEEQDGVYHYNIFLTLQLSSSHFESGKTAETFDIIVLKSFEDGVYSFAINEFPRMKALSIERYWIEMVEEHRKLRELKFLELEEQGLLEDAMNDVTSSSDVQKINPDTIDLNAEKAKFKQMSTEKLNEMENNSDTYKLFNFQKYLISKELDMRWKNTYRASQLKYDEKIKQLHGRKMFPHDDL